MAAYDYKRDYKNSEKKGVCSSSGTLIPADNDAIAIADTATLFRLPAFAVVTNAFIVVKKGATTGTQTLKITVGSTDVIAAVAVGTADGAIKGGTVTRAYTGTGADVTVTGGVAELADGEFEVVVEYVEYTKTTGELTNI